MSWLQRHIVFVAGLTAERQLVNRTLGFALTAIFLLLVGARADAGKYYDIDADTLRAEQERYARAFDALMEQ